MVSINERKEEYDWKNAHIRVTKTDKKRQGAGVRAEEVVRGILQDINAHYIEIHDVYFETDYFNFDVGMYQTMQIDHILIAQKAIYVIETKHLPSNAILTGGSNTKKWIYTEFDAQHKKHTHADFVRNLIKAKTGVDVPVISIVNLDGIKDENVQVFLKYKHEVVCTYELKDKILYYENRFASRDDIDVMKMEDLIKSEAIYDGIIPQIDDVKRKHLVYVKLVNKNAREKAKTGRRRKR